MKKSNKYKAPKGIVSFTVIIVLLSSILAASVYYENSITANAVRGTTSNNQEFNLQIIYIDSTKDLSQLNEGWYQIRNGYVYYLDSFSSYIPIWIKIINPEEQNGLLVVDADGTTKFDRTFTGLPESEVADDEEIIFENQISGNAVGMEKVSGFTVAMITNTDKTNFKYCKKTTASCNPGKNDVFSEVLPPKNSWVCKDTTCSVVPDRGLGGTTGTSTAQANELTVFTKSDSYYRVVVENDKVNVYKGDTLQNSIPTKLFNYKEILWQDYDGSDKYPISRDGLRTIVSDIKYIDTFTTNNKITKTIETNLLASGYKETITITNPDTPNQQKTEVLTLDIQTTITTNYKVNSNDVDKVTVKTKDGTLELLGNTYSDIINQFPNNPYDILRIAAQEGFKKVELKDGKISDGSSKSILQIETDGQTRTLVFDGQIIKKELSNGVEIIYTGYVTLDGKRVILGNGASSETIKKDEKGKITYYKSELIGNDGLTSIETEYKDGTTTVKLYKRDDPTNIESWKVVSTFNIVGQVTEQKNQFYGMYEFTKDGETFYYDKTNLGSVIIKDASGKDVTEQFKDDKTALGVGIDQLREKVQAKSTVLQQKSQAFFAQVEKVFTEFRGLGYYATLFFDEGSLLAWRDSVDRIFATLYLGTEYWSSGLCSQYIDGEDNGIAYAETPQGLAQVGAHVEATRTKPISGLNGTEFIYKITFNVRNGDFDKDPRAPEEMNINIVLKGQKTARVFKNNIKIERGDTFGRVGSSAIVQDSNFLYREVCITFDKVPFKWSIDGNELCNSIIEGSGEPTPLSGKPSSSGTGSTSPGNDINDF